MLGKIEHALRKRASKWLLPGREREPGEVFLHQRRVFIMPSHPGLGFCAMLLALFIGSINYNLSLGFALTFLIGACALIDMHLTFRNLAHLHLAAGRVSPVFAGEEARFELHLINRRKHDRYALWIDFVGEGLLEVIHHADVAAQATTTVTLSAPARSRGWMQAPRVRLQTRFPLGLLRAWSYWQPDAQALVYPHPEENAPALPIAGVEQSEGEGGTGEEDFAGIRGYQVGDSLKRLAWRQIAKIDLEYGGNLVTKHFEGGAATEVCIDFTQLPNYLDPELKLSRMTRWVIEAETRGLSYSLHLGSTHLQAGTGPAHKEACLRALALYPS